MNAGKYRHFCFYIYRFKNILPFSQQRKNVLYLKNVKQFAMRKSWQFLFPLLVFSLLFNGCKKNIVDEKYTPVVNPVTPDFTTKINAAVNGFITDENGEAVEGATITAGTATTTTDEFGYFKITNTPFAKSAGFIRVSKVGYFTGYRTFVPIAGKQTFTRLQLIPKTTSGTIDAVAGGTVSIPGGATVTLVQNAVVNASNSNPYAGSVNIAAHWFDPSDIKRTTITMPGDLTGVDSAGHLNILETFGMLAVELTGSSGELLQIAPGKKATLHFPLPPSLQSAAPSYIPLWYFDEAKGVWKQEGHAIKNGSSYDGEVSHFSFWNCDWPYYYVNLRAQVVDQALRPLANTPVTVTAIGFNNVSRTGFTDTNGVVTGFVPANTELKIDIIAPCDQGTTVNTVTSKNTDIDLGTLRVDLNQYATSITGVVNKCNGSPVTDGFVIITGFGNNSIIEINNGVFSSSGSICPGTNAALIAFDRENSQQSEMYNITLNSGTNNAGTIQACTVSTTEYITVSFTSGGVSYTLPQYMFGGNFYFMNDSTSINAIDLLNGNQQVFQFSFTGAATAGEHPLSNNKFTMNGSLFVFSTSQSVTVSSYGLIGQFMTGTIEGIGSLDGGPLQGCVINFNIQRDQ